MLNFAKRIEKSLECIAMKHADSASCVCFYEPEIPNLLKDAARRNDGSTLENTTENKMMKEE